MNSDDKEEEYIVRNADTNERMTVSQAAEKFSVLTINEIDQAE
jgi:hypothetical protein